MAFEKDQKVTVTATIIGHKTHNGKPMTEIDVPEWGSQHPFSLYNMDVTDQDRLPVNSTVRIELNCDRSRPNKPQDDKAWNYYWSFAGFSFGTAPTPAAPAARPQAQAAAAAAVYGENPRDASIERQVALKAAVEIYVAQINNQLPPDNTLQNADEFAAWLRAGRELLTKPAEAGAPAEPDPMPFADRPMSDWDMMAVKNEDNINKALAWLERQESAGKTAGINKTHYDRMLGSMSVSADVINQQCFSGSKAEDLVDLGSHTWASALKAACDTMLAKVEAVKR